MDDTPFPDERPNAADTHAMHDPAPTSPHLYLSYSAGDRDCAASLCSRLEAHGIRCWMAPRDVAPGESYSRCIEGAIEAAPSIAVLISAASVRSASVVAEVRQAVAAGKRVFPVYLDSVRLNPEWQALVSDFRGIRLQSGLPGPHDIDALARSIANPAPATPGVRTSGTEAGSSLRKALRSLARCCRPSGRPQGGPTPLPSRVAVELPPRDGAAGVPSGRPTAFDIFISYRRDRDAQTARLIRSELERRGYRVFLDVDDLRPGHFDEALFARIRGATAFVVILSPGSLERCVDPADWLRKEIVCAISGKRVIIPILMPGFGFPPEKEIPPELVPLRVHHGINYTHDFFDAMMQRIVDYAGQPSASA